MNSRQLQYIIKLSETRNISQAAEELKITQPALSKQVLGLEKDLGVKLFDRSTTPMTITPAGEHFIREAQQLLYKEDQLLRSMQRFQAGEIGTLSIGITPFRCSYLMPDVVKAVRQHYPGIQIRLHEHGSEQLRKDAAEGKYDFTVVNLPVDESLFDIIPLEKDRLVLAVPEELISRIPVEPENREISFQDCANLPFVVVGQTQEMRRLFDKLCSAADIQPTIAAEVVSLTAAWAMAQAGVAATILPMQFINRDVHTNHLILLDLKDAVYHRQPVIITRRGQHLTDAAQFAIRLLQNTATAKQ